VILGLQQRFVSRLPGGIRQALVLMLGTLAVACGPVPSQSVSQPSISPSTEQTSTPTPVSLTGWFAFTVEGGDLWAMRGDGSDRLQLTRSADGVDISPTWAPGASRLAYRHSTGAGGGTQDADTIRVVRADGNGERDLVAGSFPAWSPDGAWIAFRGVAGVDLALIRPDGNDLTSLGAPNAECPVWSPDGMQILYCRNEDASGAVSDNWEVWVMNRDGSHKRQLTDDPARDYPIAWSADGSKIVFFSERDGNAASFVMDADGSKVARVTNATDLSSVGAWLPDGRFVISSAGPDIPEWYVLASDGTRQRIPQLSGAFDPIGWVDAR
jgi:Tol biopolymer transport system component